MGRKLGRWLASVLCVGIFLSGNASGAEGGIVLPKPQSQFRVERGVSYLDEGRAEKADLYLPAGRMSGQARGALVFIHGGGFFSGRRDGEREEAICVSLVCEGYVVMSIDYQLAVEGMAVWPENLYDCKRAVMWLRNNASQFGVNPERIGVMGASAGGHLAAMVAVTGPGDNLEPPGALAGVSSRVACCVDLYGPSDLTLFSRLSMMGPCLAEAPELYRRASPVYFASAEDPPVLLLHGVKDDNVPAEHSFALDIALRRAGASCRLELLDGLGHGFDLEPPGKDLRPLVREFLGSHLLRP
jgi:acetyl esterase/lipase